VAFCYEHGIAHRDVKLSNIIFPPDPVAEGGQLHQGQGPRVKLADFGMAGFFAKSGTLRGR
jgi:serine/threonine protein kinase